MFSAAEINTKRIELSREKNEAVLIAILAFMLWLLPLCKRSPAWVDLTLRLLAVGNAACLVRRSDDIARQEQLLSVQIHVSRQLLNRFIDVQAYQEEQAIIAPIMPEPPQFVDEVEPRQLPASQGRSPQVESDQDQGTQKSQSEDYSHDLVRSLNDYKIKTSCEGRIEGACFDRYLLRKQANGIKVNAIAKLSPELMLDLGLKTEPIVSIQDGFIAVDIERRDRNYFRYEDFIKPGVKPLNGIWLPIGVSLGGELIEVDLSDPEACHILGGGTTGSGKSVWLQVAAKSLCDRYDPPEVQLVLSDYGQATFGCFEGDPHLLSPVLYDIDDIAEMQEVLVGEMERRKSLLRKHGVSNLEGLNKKLETPLPRICDFTDEYSAMIKACSDEQREQIESNRIKLALEARKTGIHLNTFMQRPDADYLDTQIRSNHPAAICLKVKRPEDSKIILAEDNLGGEKLLGKGDLLFSCGGKIERLQSLYWDANNSTKPGSSDRVYQFVPKPSQAPGKPTSDDRYAYRYPPNWKDIASFTQSLTGRQCCYPGCNQQAASVHHACYQEGDRNICNAPKPGEHIFPLCPSHHQDRSNPECAHHKDNWVYGTCQEPLEIDSHNTPEYHALLRQGWLEKTSEKLVAA